MKRFAIATLILAALPAFAQVAVKDPWVRATVPQQRATGAFMHLTASQDTRLVEVRSGIANVVEIHEMSMDRDVMKMRAVSGLDLPGGKSVELKPGGYHIMLMDLKQQMKEGDTVSLTLVLEDKDKKRNTLDVRAPVKPLSAPAASGGMQQKHGH